MSSTKDPFAKPLATTDDDFASVDALGSGEMSEEASEATSIIHIATLDTSDPNDDHPDSLTEDQRRAKEVGVSMASAQIEPLPESPRALLHFSDERPPQPVTKSVFVFGRSKEFADVTVEGDNVSRHHAALIFSSGEFFIEDLNSTNGTTVAGKRIRRSRLEPDVPVTIGAITFRLRWEY